MAIIATPTGANYDYVAVASTLQTVIDGKNIQRIDISVLLVELVLAFIIGCVIILVANYFSYVTLGLTFVGLYVILLYSTHYLFSQYLILADVSWAIICLTIVGFHSTFNRFH